MISNALTTLLLLPFLSGCLSTSTSMPKAPSPLAIQTVPPAVGTFITSGGAFSSAADGELLTGYRLLEVEESNYPLTSRKGLVETFPEVGLPRARQVIVVPVHDTTLDFVQEPVIYPNSDPPADAMVVEFGEFQGLFWRRANGDSCFEFLTGVTIDAIEIRASVCALGGGYSKDDLRRFVEALTP